VPTYRPTYRAGSTIVEVRVRNLFGDEYRDRRIIRVR
jgi:hypothetical protein